MSEEEKTKKVFDELKYLNQLTACLLTPAAAGKQGRERGWGKEIGGTSAFSKKHILDVPEHRSMPSGLQLWLLLWAVLSQTSVDIEVTCLVNC